MIVVILAIKHCLKFLLGLTMVPRENKNNAYAKFEGTKKEYYGIFRSGLLEFMFSVFMFNIDCSSKLSRFFYFKISIERVLPVGFSIDCHKLLSN